MTRLTLLQHLTLQHLTLQHLTLQHPSLLFALHVALTAGLGSRRGAF